MNTLSRRTFLHGGAATALTLAVAPQAAHATSTTGMDAMTAILTRRSVRAYTEAPVSQEHIEALLRAAMAAPSAGNEQPWEFVVITDKAKLREIPKVNRFAGMAKNAPLAILTCVSTEREKHPGNGVLDVSAATQNILLAAHALGLGAVWTGVYPEKDRMDGFRQIFALPENIMPLALVVIGQPKAKPEKVDRFLPERVHRNLW